MGYRKFSEVVGPINPGRRARIDAKKAEARADTVAFNAELPSNGAEGILVHSSHPLGQL